MSDATRRDFLKTSSIAAAVGAGMLNSISHGAFSGGSDEIRIGLVGCGGRGSGAAGQALSTVGKTRLVAVGDVFPDQLEKGLKQIEKRVAKAEDAVVDVNEDHKFVGFDAYQKVIDSDVDLVILATPPGFRPIHFEYAVSKGKHCFIEKPVAVDAAGVQRVLDAARVAKEKNLMVGVGLQRRHQGCYLDTIKRIHDGEIGDICAMRVYWNANGVWEPRATREQCKSEMEYQMRNWYYYNWLCGDHIVEQHIHNIDVANWVKQAYPVKAIGMGGRQVRVDPRYGEIFDHHAVQFTYEDGTTLFSECRHIPNCWASVSEAFVGTKGSANTSANAKSCNITVKGGATRRYDGEAKDPFQVEHDDFQAALRAGRIYNEAEYGAMSTMSSILGRMATYSGKEITMADALARGVDLMPTEFGWDAPTPTKPDAEGRYPIAVPGVTQVLKPQAKG
ncbi:Gfo/Idh/MocA family oxidoreductase [Planctomicrobium sp. SH664]|uniref:Gfo/Idh/MocA family protein n=1 Tax=Planctomicrobium sp. SH664 TaxID=3448125 RepID=UPI003F5B1345